MKKMLTLAVITVALLGASHTLASEVTNVALSYQEGSTVACINVEGAVRFTHQTEEAKDGKSFRVIVDILSATHKLGANNFMSLPNCPVQSIRSSQFAVTPEAVVRVVFDMKGEQVYRVDSDNKSVKLYFSDKSGQPFATWSTAANAPKAAKVAVKKEEPKKAEMAKAPQKPAQKSAVELNKSIKNDRMASLQGEPKKAEPKKVQKPAPVAAEKPAVAKKKPAAKPTVAKVSKGDALYGPFMDKPLTEADQPVKAKAAPAAKPKQVAKAPAKPKPQSKPLAKAEQPKKAEPKAKPALKSVVEKPAAKPVAAKKSQTVAQAKPEAKNSQRSTSRFRRSPAQSRKIKGTLVAEFPKRLVIKYKAKRHRDPFHTLLDESKTYDSPIERQVPNVEGLKLVGVIEAGSKDNRALFEDKDGYGYILKTGDKVQKGYVLRVEADRVYFQIFEYGWSRTVALHLES
jgi:hypothetical protein